MTAPERRRPLPALAFIGALSLLTALVWFRVLHRTDASTAGPSNSTSSSCPSPSPTPSATPTVLPVPTKVTVLVLNSTNRNGIAGDTRSAPSALPSPTLLSYYFPHAKLLPTDSSSARVMVALGAKFKKVTAA